MVLHHALDLVGRDAVAESLDDVVLAAQEPDVAVRVVARVVAGEEPAAVLERLGGFLGQVPVAQEQARIVGRDADHALLAGRRLIERLGVEQPHVVAGLREARADRADGAELALRKIIAEHSLMPTAS